MDKEGMLRIPPEIVKIAINHATDGRVSFNDSFYIIVSAVLNKYLAELQDSKKMEGSKDDRP